MTPTTDLNASIGLRVDAMTADMAAMVNGRQGYVQASQ